MEAPAGSTLRAYLADRFKPAAWVASASGDGVWDDALLTRHFIDTFGVTMKVEENLYSFKYDQVRLVLC